MWLLFRHNRDDVLVSYDMAQPHTLWNMSCASAPYHRVFESFLQSPMDLITHILNGRLVPDDQGFTEVRFLAFAAGLSDE